MGTRGNHPSRAIEERRLAVARDSEEVRRTFSGEDAGHYSGLLEHKFETFALSVMTRLYTGLYFVSAAVLR